jgi:hypothetical protein
VSFSVAWWLRKYKFGLLTVRGLANIVIDSTQLLMVGF